MPGVDKLRINPGNIGSKDRVQEVVKAAQSRGVPIRIGVNAGSLEKDLLAKYGRATPEAMVESALRHVAILEELDFFNIVISVKAFDVLTTWQAYRLLAARRSYPLHIGITGSWHPLGWHHPVGSWARTHFGPRSWGYHQSVIDGRSCRRGKGWV